MNKYKDNYFVENFKEKFLQLLDIKYSKLKKSERKNQFVIDCQIDDICISRSTVDAWCRNSGRKQPCFENLVTLCNFFHCDMDYFFCDVDSPSEDIVKAEKLTDLDFSTIYGIIELNASEKLILKALIKTSSISILNSDIHDWFQMDKIVTRGDGKESELSNETRSKIKEYFVAESMKQVFHILSHDKDVANYFMRMEQIKLLDFFLESKCRALENQTLSSKEREKRIAELKQEYEKDKAKILSTDYYSSMVEL